MLLPNEGYRLIGGYDYGGNIFVNEKARGANHALEGVLAAFGPFIRKGERVCDARVIDIAPTILRMLGYYPPKSMDGRPVDVFLPRAAKHDLQDLKGGSSTGIEEGMNKSDQLPTKEASSSGLSKMDEGTLAEKLRALGYID